MISAPIPQNEEERLKAYDGAQSQEQHGDQTKAWKRNCFNASHV